MESKDSNRNSSSTTTQEETLEEKPPSNLQVDTTSTSSILLSSPIPDRIRGWTSSSSPKASALKLFSPRKNVQVHHSPKPKNNETAKIVLSPKLVVPQDPQPSSCLICMDAFTSSRKPHPIPCNGQCSVDQDDVRVHYRCIMAWLSTSNNSCPLCRGPCDPTTLLPPSIESLNVDNMKHLVTNPISLDAGIVRCYVKQSRKRLSNTRNWWKPTGSICYELFLQAPVNNPNNTPDRLMLTAVKLYDTKFTSTYEISVENNILIGRLSSNFFGTAFHLYNDGSNPTSTHIDLASLRHELAVITYEANRASVGPRKMKVGIPTVNEETSSVTVICPTRPSEKLGARLQNSDNSLMVYYNREPEFREDLGAYCLDFGGRVSMASVKNFQLVCQDDPSVGNVLQFGRIDHNMFTMDFQWPLSPLQAFGISLSSCDTKLACV